jgi:hypothetical protein
MIPPAIDVLQIVSDLNGWGWRDYKIEVACGLGSGYIAQVRCGGIKEPAYGKAARLHNFWFEQRTVETSKAEHLQTRLEFATTA